MPVRCNGVNILFYLSYYFNVDTFFILTRHIDGVHLRLHSRSIWVGRSILLIFDEKYYKGEKETLSG